ncbi:hypothetical protein [Nitrosospira lacus]|uniref:hypothetical protein n=1 Tax=Nitrosospira lacus TaxID=1288494 RepID=UPI001D131CAB|nr:hypothetical protein [Nitrosospira lacus]
MTNMPGRDGAVTGGTFDQSNRALALGAAGVATAPAVAVAAGVVVAGGTGAGSAAKTCNASPSVPAPRHNFNRGPRMRAGNAAGVALIT